MLPSFSVAFATLLNVAIKVHPDMDTVPLEGRSFCVAIDELPQDIAIRIDHGRVLALEEAEVADVTVSGSLKAVIDMMNHENEGLDSDDLYIAGKISTARQFQHFLASFSVDWQAFFAQFMPEAQAAKTADVLAQGIHAAKGSIEQLGLGVKVGVKDFLIHDKKLLVQRSELDELADGIVDLHQRLDALLATLASK